MIRISTLFLSVIALLSVPFTASAHHTYTSTGGSASYSLINGDSLKINSGNYTGSISAFDNGAVITVASGATFQPSSLNNAAGVINNYGTIKLAFDFNPNSNFTINNSGLFWVTKNINMNGSSESWTNKYGATMNLDKGFIINSGNDINNAGTITNSGSVTMNSGSSFTNTNVFNVTGTFTTNSATITNSGKLYATGLITFNAGTTLTNNCRLITDGGITNNATAISNYGLFWSTAASASTTITNSGTINNHAQARMKSVNFTNWGTLTGSGYLYFTGTTTNTGTTGVSGVTTDTLKIYDVTRTNSSHIFDVQNGTVRPNTIYSVFTAPDTVGSPSTCSPQSITIPLAIQWNYFYVNQDNSLPVLYWSAEQSTGTVYSVERSYNGVDFYPIAAVPSKTGVTDYSFDDNAANTQMPVVYYRVMGTELTGAQKISDTRAVKFSNNAGVTMQTAPNPFTSQFNINYQSTENGMVSIKVFSMTGQLQLVKNTTVSNGYNSIAVNGVSTLSAGIYMVQLSAGSKIIATQKVVKQ